ncbi:Methyltransferase domain [Rhizoctonia solani]|uniref:Methyltransferase domain n=1 Tax=Rhizoctonia solani TaxID=456999 RepID=A0A8H7M2J7_9AGAM|nr:Methyltransferase domain [Rhizoctonia solani]
MKNTISKPRPSLYPPDALPCILHANAPRLSSEYEVIWIECLTKHRALWWDSLMVQVNVLPRVARCSAIKRYMCTTTSTKARGISSSTRPQVYQPPPTPSKSSPARSSSSFTSPPKPPVLRRLSTATTLQRHLSIANSTSVLPFSTKRRRLGRFSFEEDLGPISPVRNVIRRKSSVPLSPRLTRGAGLSRSQASRRTRRSRNNLNSRGPATPIDHNRPLSVYSAYSFYTPSQIDDDDEDFGHVIRSPDPASSFMNINADSLSDQEDWNEFGEVPAGANLEPRGSVSSIATIRPPADQRNPSRLGGLKDKLRCQWLGHRSGQGQEMSSDESLHNRSGSDVSLSPSAGAASNRPAYSRARTTPNRPVVFNKPGFKSLSKSSQTPSDFRPDMGTNLLQTRSGSSSCGDDWTSEEGHDYTAKPLPASRASSIISPAPPVHSRNNSDNYAHLRPNSVSFVEPIRKPAIRIKNGVPHHSCDPEEVPYPLSYSSNMLEADRWNHALLFGDERNPANAGGLLRGSTVSFSQFYGVGSGKKEVLKGKELRAGKCLTWGVERGCGFLRLPKSGRIEWVQGDFLNEKLPFADNSFDLVRLANTTLALPTDANTGNYRLRGLFGEIFRVLKVNGEFEMIDEKHTVPSASQASPSCPDNAAFDPYAGTQMRQLEQAFARMLQHHELSAYDTIPNLLRQHFSTSSEKATFRLAVAPEQSAVDNPAVVMIWGRLRAESIWTVTSA